jgi:hypothetical protein
LQKAFDQKHTESTFSCSTNLATNKVDSCHNF